MPSAAPHPCAERNCPALVPHGQSRCPAHTKERKRQADKARPSAAARGYGWRWVKIRAIVLSQEPICRHCWEREQRTTPATEVDHIVPLSRGGGHNWDNLQPLCHAHHVEKSQTIDEFTWPKKVQ